MPDSPVHHGAGLAESAPVSHLDHPPAEPSSSLNLFFTHPAGGFTHPLRENVCVLRHSSLDLGFHRGQSPAPELLAPSVAALETADPDWIKTAPSYRPRIVRIRVGGGGSAALG